ncbi:MAG: MmcQ/YjbR family DNA-binding protein [Rhizobiaceae bacterium]|nr:MmcQ/YjbR family DNA-binding protein [Rhizobiaceae bacterium]
MNRKKFNSICKALPKTTHVVQWGNADVWKIGGKIFAIGSRWGKDNARLDVKISFKCSDFSYSLLIQEKGFIPAPYLARAKWVQIDGQTDLSDDEIKAYIHAAYDIIVQKLTKVLRKELSI